jgi:uncharacterized tellurite resistance protein B-like protein
MAGPDDKRALPEQHQEDREPAVAIRNAICQLESLDIDTARYLDALAFVLTRVADADDVIQAEETDQIEHILQEFAGLAPEQAVLVAEIAKHRKRLADSACTYRVSRDLRLAGDPDQRDRVLRFLLEVARADGQVSGCEETAIIQIAAELGLSRADIEALIEQAQPPD